MISVIISNVLVISFSFLDETRSLNDAKDKRGAWGLNQSLTSAISELITGIDDLLRK